MFANKILIFLFYVFLIEQYFGSVSSLTYYENQKTNEKSKNDGVDRHTETKQKNDQYDYNINQNYEYEYDDDKCKPEPNTCICTCTKNRMYDCLDCIVLKENNLETCNPGDLIKFTCPLCLCDQQGRHVCDKCVQTHYKKTEKINNEEDNEVYRKKREEDSFYYYLYKDSLPLSTEQTRELERQDYFQNVIDQTENQELAENAETARQNAETAKKNAEANKILYDTVYTVLKNADMLKQFNYKDRLFLKRLDEAPRAIDAQQNYINDYIYEDTNHEEQVDYFSKKK